MNAVKYGNVQSHNLWYWKNEYKYDRKIEKRRAANCVYHIGASIKDLGKKCFGFSKMATK